MSKENTTEIENTNLLRQNFKKDKEFLIKTKKEYLKADKIEEKRPTVDSLREEISKEINQGNLSNALVKLEELKDLKSGITHTIKYNNNEKGERVGTPVLIRDARNCKLVLSTESFEMQYLNVLRAGIEIANYSENKPLETALMSMRNNFAKKIEDQGLNRPIIIEEKNPKIKEEKIKKAEEKRQKKLSDLVKAEKKNIVIKMNNNGVVKAAKILEKAQNYQNFNNQQKNIITISTISGRQFIESEVGLRELTPTQKEDYQKIVNNRSNKDNKDLPEWFNKLSKWEQELLSKKYAKIILRNEHVMPTQLVSNPGMRNAFEKTTEIIENEGSKAGTIKTLHVSNHAGTLLVDSNDKEISQRMTNENARQAQMWFGEKKLHCNTFNAGVVGMGLDPKIVSMTTKAMKNVGGKETNTSFNKFRLLGVANDYTGVKDTLKNIAKTHEELTAHIMPRSRVERLFGLNKAKNDAEDILKNIKEPEATIYRNAIELRKDVEKADVPFKIFGDKENINLTISTKLNILNNTINHGSDLNLPKEKILNMCKSGKDRTGLSMHDQSAQVIAAELKIDIKDVDRELLKNGHTAQQAGSISAGGGTIGCYGTKSENKAGIPMSRIKNLISIIEKSASGNKIKVKDQPLNGRKLTNAIKANETTKELAPSMKYKTEQLANNQKKSVSNSITIKVKSPTRPIKIKKRENSQGF